MQSLPSHDVSPKFHAQEESSTVAALQKEIDRLRQSNRVLRELITNINLAYIELDLNYRIVEWGGHGEALFGYDESTMLDRPITDLISTSEDKETFLQFFKDILDDPTRKLKTLRLITKTHGELLCDVYYSPVLNASGKPTRIAFAVQDITAILTTRENLNRIRKELEDIFGNAPIGIYRANAEGRFVAANPELAWMLGFESADMLVRSVTDIASQIFADEGKSEEFFFSLFEAEQLSRFRCELVRQDGSTFWALAYAHLARNNAGRVDGFYGFTIDITNTVRTEMKLQQMNDELKTLSIMDSLTQIANRRRFDEVMACEWKRLRREGQCLSLILCDIDYFKNYNDTYGHKAGDECLQAVAKAIAASVKRPSDLVARYGGEEFVVILPNTTADGAFHVAEIIRKAVRNLSIPHEASRADKVVTLSLGAAGIVPGEGHSPKTIINQADQALYLAKDQGRNRSVMHQD